MSSAESRQDSTASERERRLIAAARAEAQGAADLGATVMAGAPPLPRAIPQIPNYTIVSEVGRGGQGVVYKAVQQSTKREVAVKVLLAGTLASESERKRFEREMDLIAAMRHPNIVTVFDGGVTSEGHQWYAMEYIEDIRLDSYVRSRGELKAECGRDAT